MIKKLQYTLLISIISIFIIGCKNSEKEPVKQNENNIDTKDTSLDKLETEASRLRAGGSVKNVAFNDGNAIITYVKDYSEYKKLNPQSSLTENDLENYWENGSAIEKALIDGSVKIMTKLDFINSVEIILPYKNKTYSITVSKEELEKFTNSDFNQIKSDLEHNFSNLYVYDKEGRKKFFNKFGKIE